ncbi:MAG: enoyl-CoA hydratase/isomerase family protein [Actinobacteria bacterium]|nr:enoyl-CoA hydratase/isomerase family protein [Actinomycetota bacterium]
MSYETIRFDVEGPVAWLRLNRPQALNALTSKLSEEAGDAIASVAANDDARCLVITGEGRGFCAGQDLKDPTLGATPAEIDFGGHLRRTYNRLVTSIVELPKPVIAGVNGVAAGAGVSLACACDVRVVSSAASFIQAFIKIGLLPDSGGNYLLPRVVGYAKALELSITGDRVSADEAHRIGLASVVVDADRFDQELAAYAARLAAMPTKAIGASKTVMREAWSMTLAETLEREAVVQADLGQSHDFSEGIAAFLEKRDPNFLGR